MNARLLDMGEVNAVRSQSITHAIAATMGPDDYPVAVLLRSVSRMVSIGADRDPVDEINLELCLEHRIPVLRQFGGGPAQVIDRNRLLVSCVFPAGSEVRFHETTGEPIVTACRTLGLAVRLGPNGELVTGQGGGVDREIGSVRTGTIEGSTCVLANLAVEPAAPEPEGGLLSATSAIGTTTASSLRIELGRQPESGAVAEALVTALESSFGLEMLPSMPTPDEMDAIYEWDESLVLDLETMAGSQVKPTEQLVC